MLTQHLKIISTLALLGVLVSAPPASAISCAYWKMMYNRSQADHRDAERIVRQGNSEITHARQDIYKLVNWAVTVFYPTMMRYYSNGKVVQPQFLSVDELNLLVSQTSPAFENKPLSNISSAVAFIEASARIDDMSDTLTYQKLQNTLVLVRHYSEELKSARITEQQAYSNVISLLLLSSMAEGNRNMVDYSQALLRNQHMEMRGQR